MRPLLQDLSSGLAAVAYHGGAVLACGLPAPVARGAGRAVGLLCWALQKGRRVALRENFARLAHGDRPAAAARVRRAFGNFGESVVDTLRLAHIAPAEVDRQVRIEGVERLRRAAGSGGAVLLAAHAGNWEWAGAALAARGLRVAAIARPHAAGAQRFFDALRTRFGVTAAPSLRALAVDPRPCVVAVFCDRPGRTARARHPERIARGAVALAARRGWSALPAVTLRDSNGYRVIVGPELPPARTRRERQVAAERALAFLEAHLGGHLDQWFAFEPVRAAR